MKIPDRASLEKRRGIIIADLLAKVDAEDWHGVADCAMDCREIDAQARLLALQEESWQIRLQTGATRGGQRGVADAL